ncbi:MAG: FKBP-type peptidyl-prolyl cis-trans isomerase 2 [Cyclobacteriaceae bacterium]|jgi:FKBP-type peptidyl-prolyl cis-trans isomerase 2
MSIAKSKDTVKVHYTGKLEGGQIFDSSVERDPLQFVIDEGQMIKGFNDAVIGMSIEEEKSVTIPKAEAYGEYNEQLIQDVSRGELPEDMQPEVGQTLVASSSEGQQQHVVIKEVTAESIKIDANHPLAGKDLIFDIQLLEIV